MELSPEAEEIANRIQRGELPSAVMRDMLVRRPGVSARRDLASWLHEAYGEFTLVNFVWNWKESARSAAQDTRFDIWVINALLKMEISLPWDRAYCDAEYARIQPMLAAEAEAQRKADLAAFSFESLYEKLRSFEGRPACIEAIWDGDSQGWFVVLMAIMEVDSAMIEKCLGSIRLGGDIRLFNGEVPPWPEAVLATEVGTRLANVCKAVFHFHSPDEPRGDRPRWIDRQGAR